MNKFKNNVKNIYIKTFKIKIKNVISMYTSLCHGIASTVININHNNKKLKKPDTIKAVLFTLQTRNINYRMNVNNPAYCCYHIKLSKYVNLNFAAFGQIINTYLRGKNM